MALNPHEGKLLREIENSNLAEQALLDRALREINDMLEGEKIDPNDFLDIYDKDTIAAHLAYVEDRNRVFMENATKERLEAKNLALLFEGIFHRGAHKYGWLGEGTSIIKTSDFDDWYHGVDGIIEFEYQKKKTDHLAIGIDVTYSISLKEKFEKIKNDIRHGELPTIQYFRSGNFRGELSKIPRVVVGAERSHLIKLCKDLFVEPDEKRLVKHPFQVLQLKQMRLQLDAFAAYARNLGKDDIAEVYERDAEIVREILQKKSVGESVRMGEWEEDRVFQAIKKELENLK